MKNNTVTRYIEQRLKAWANYYLRYGDYGLGFPKKSLVATIMEGTGYTPGQGRAPQSIPENEAAEQMECLVNELALQNAKLATALRAYYFGVGSVKQRAQSIHVSYAHFRVQLDMAIQWLAGRMTTLIKEVEIVEEKNVSQTN